MDIQLPQGVAGLENTPPSERHTIETAVSKRNDDCLDQDTPTSNSPGVGEDLVETEMVGEVPQFSGSSDGAETEPLPKRPQRERRPPKIFRYDKIGSPLLLWPHCITITYHASSMDISIATVLSSANMLLWTVSSILF